MCDDKFQRRVEKFRNDSIRRVDHAETEAETCAALVEPYLADVLEWHVHETWSVKRDVKIGPRFSGSSRGRQGRVDYALLRDDHRWAFIEAKKIETDINEEDPMRQLRDYMRHDEHVKYGALTNGIRWKWFKKIISNPTNVDISEFLNHDVQNPEEGEIPYLKALSKTNADMDKLDQITNEGIMLLKCKEWLEEIQKEPTDQILNCFLRDKEFPVSPAQRSMVRKVWPKAVSVFNSIHPEPDNGQNQEPMPPGRWRWKVHGHDEYDQWKYHDTGSDLTLSIARYFLDFHNHLATAIGIRERSDRANYREVPGHPGRYISAGMADAARKIKIKRWITRYLSSLQVEKFEDSEWRQI